MKDKLKSKFIKYPILIGLIGIILITFFIFWRWEVNSKVQVSPSVTTEQMKREQTVDSYTLSCEPIAYFLKAAGNHDLDQALRAFPISELNSKTNLTQLLTLKETFSLESAPALSSVSGTYSSIGEAEITGEYASLYQEFMNNAPDLHDAELLRFSYVRIKKKEKAYYNDLKEVTGAKKFRKNNAYVRVDGAIYQISFVMMQCSSNSWKIFDIDTNIEEISEEELNQIEDLTLSEEKSKRNRERIGDVAKAQIDSGGAFLPMNYFWSDAAYGKTPEEVMKRFEICVQKNNLGGLLALGNTREEERNTVQADADHLIAQGEFASEIKGFYYTMLLGEDIEEDTLISDLGYLSTTLVEALQPSYFFYSSMTDMVPLSEEEYLVFWEYENQEFQFTFHFHEYEQGWQICDISNGVKIITDETEQESTS